MQSTTIVRPLAIAAVLTAFATVGIFAQTAPATPKAAHRPAAHTTTAQSTTMKLPANIPAAKGVLHTEFALRYIEINPGTGPLAQPGERYTVHYTGWLHDGTKFDSSVDRGTPFDFVQGQHHVITGWDEGFEGMRVGGKRRLFIPWELAYGAQGRSPIPPKADLIFDIELINATDPNAPPPPAPSADVPK